MKVDLPKPKPMLVKPLLAKELPQGRAAPAQNRGCAKSAHPKVAFNQPSPELMPAAKNTMPRLVPSIKTGVLTWSSAPATVKAPVQKVQTGGFGDENGLNPSLKSDGRGHLVMARLGSFDLPPGSGYGNGSGEPRAPAWNGQEQRALATASPVPDRAAARAAVPTAARARQAGFTNASAAPDASPHSPPGWWPSPG